MDPVKNPEGIVIAGENSAKENTMIRFDIPGGRDSFEVISTLETPSMEAPV